MSFNSEGELIFNVYESQESFIHFTKSIINKYKIIDKKISDKIIIYLPNHEIYFYSSNMNEINTLEIRGENYKCISILKDPIPRRKIIKILTKENIFNKMLKKLNI